MDHFDEWLRDALMDANLLQFEQVLWAADARDWQVTWLPEGYTLWDFYATPSFSKWFFLSDETGDSLDFGCSAPGGNSQVQIGTMPDPEGVREQIDIHGCAADYYTGDGEQILVWETPEGFLLRLLAQGSMDRETLLKIAENAACYSGSTPAYEMGWTPPDFHEMDGLYGNGACHQEWVRRGVTLSWQYVVRPPCPFTVPEETPEAVAVNGLPGRFWASPEEPEPPEEPDDSVTQFGDVTITASTSPGEETTSILIWEDPETGAAFCIKGELGKSDLLRMAESVRRIEAPPERSIPGRSETVIDNAGGDAG